MAAPLSLIVPIAFALVAVPWVVLRRLRKVDELVLTRVVHLTPDVQGPWLHVLGVSSSMPEYGDPVETWVHLLVEPRTGRFVAGARAVAEDVTWKSPLVGDSLKGLAGTLGWTPQLARGGSLPLARTSVADSPGIAPTAEPPEGSEGARQAITLAIEPVPTTKDGPTRPCLATLRVGGAVRGTHRIDALVASGFVTRLVDADQIACFAYVGTRLGSLQAHMVAMDVATGGVLFDRVVVCRRTEAPG